MMALRDRLQWCEAQLEECEQKRASTADHVRDLEFARDKRRDLWARPRTVLIDGEVMTLQQTATA
jgi:hypothetical protein